MSMDLAEARRLRIREAGLAEEFGRLDRIPTTASPCLLAQTTRLASYPTVAQSFYACFPLTVLGAEIEGGAGVVAPGSASFLALNLGGAIPPLGTIVVATFVDNRWVFRFDG